MTVSPPRPNRIVSLLASATEILYGIGAGDRVVGISHECDYPPEALKHPRVTRANIDSQASSAAIDEEVRTKLSQGSALYEIDQRQLVTLSPDLIVTQSQCDVCAVRYEDVLAVVRDNDALRDTNVVALNPMSLDDVLADIESVGQACGQSEGALAYRQQLETRIRAITEQTAALVDTDRPRVALIEWIEPLMLSGNWLPEMVTLAGGRHGLTTPGEHSPYVPWADVQAYDPEVIVILPCGFDLKRTVAESTSLRELPGWAELSAVRAGRVFAVDGNAYFNRAGPRLVESLEILAHLIQPERFPQPSELGSSDSLWRPLC